MIKYLFVLFYFFPYHLFSQQAVVNRITINDGLSQNYIFVLHQDSKGFIWIGTKDGLNRYDGYSFKIYRKDNADSLSLVDNNVTAIYEENEFILWIGTANGGLLRFDRLTEQFHRYQNDPKDPNSISSDHISTIKKYSTDELLIGTRDGGLNIYNKAKNLWKQFRYDSLNVASLVGDHVVDAEIDKKGNIWVSGAGISIIDTAGIVRRVPIEVHNTSLNRTGTLFFDRRGRMWITDRAGLALYDGEKFQSVYLANEQNQLFWTGAVREDSKGNFWSISSHYLVFIDGKTLQSEVKAYFPEERVSSSLLIDHSDNVWIGTAGWGIIQYNPRTDKFGKREGNFLEELFTNEFRIDKKFITEKLVDFGIRGNEFRMPFKDSRGNIFIAGSGGFVYKVTSDNILMEYDLVNSTTTSRSMFNAFHIFQDGKGTIWINRNDGLVRFTGEKKLNNFISLYPKNTIRSGQFSYSDITTVFHDSDSTLWFGTPLFGLLEYHPNSDNRRWYKFREHDTTSLSHNHVLCIIEDPYKPKKYLWIGTEGGGLNKFDRTTKTFSAITERQGFPNNTVYGILVDEEKMLWISTNKGLVKFDPRTKAFRVFDVHDGLQSNEFNRKEFYKASDGKMYFGGVSGYNAFYPKDITVNTSVPNVVFTDFRVFNKSVLFRNDTTILKAPIEFTQQIELDYFDNVITFEFSGLEYSAPAKNQYQYMLEGFDNTWIYNGTSRTATFTNIDPGEYTLKVKASNGDGIWNEKESSIRLVILPPFWLTTWFKVLLVVLFISVGPGIYYFRVSKLKKEKLRQQHVSKMLIESQESERKRIAQEMHDSLGQELLVIKNRAIMGLKSATEDSKEKKQLEQISDGATNILKLVRTLSHNLRPPELDRLGLTATIRAMLSTLRDSSSFTLHAEIDEIDSVVKKEDEINIIRILQESISNIEKHSAATTVEISIKKESNAIRMAIRDNGKGFSPETKPYGLGLAGISERVRILQGSLTISSTEHEGTLFTIIIPINAVST